MGSMHPAKSWSDSRLQKRLSALFRRARASVEDVSAACLATADERGRPSARMVLVKDIDLRGFVFFGSAFSRKARDIDRNPQAALVFYWPEIGIQIRIEGAASVLSPARTDAYFATRPRESQLAAWASVQSHRLNSRAALVKRFKAARARFNGGPVLRPRFWMGFRLRPVRIEFWRARPHRLHERTLYVRAGSGWRRTLLYP